MFRFANPEYIYLLLVVPALVVVYLLMKFRRSKSLKRYGNPTLIKRLMPELSAHRPTIKFWLLILAVIALVFVIAGPQFGSKLESVKREGVEIMIALDISNSMLSEDVAPSRLEKAKQIVSRLIDELNNDKIGMIVFAGEAFTQLPITSDYISAKMFLSSINPALIPQQGTAIGAAINLAARSFTPDESTSKAIIVITDGENHEDDAVGAAKRAEEKGIKINVIGVGLPQGAPIPVNNLTNEYRRDKDGNVIITKLNEEMCQQIAQAGTGIYVRADNTNTALRAISGEVTKMSKGEVESKVYTEFDEKFHILAWIALILLLLEFCVLEKKNRLFKHVRLFTSRTTKTTIILLFISATVTISAQKAERSHVRSGNRIYEKAIKDTSEVGKSKMAEAEIEYRKALEVNQRSVPATFNLANSMMKQQKYEQAVNQYQIAITNTQDKNIKAAAFHNIGNIAMEAQQYDKAVEVYKQSLRLNPTDDETRYNYALAKELLKKQQQQQEEQEDQQQQDKKEDNKEQQQNENQQDNQNQDQNQNQPPPEEEKDQMSKENAQQILDAFLQDEKATQEKVKKQQMQPQRKTERDW